MVGPTGYTEWSLGLSSADRQGGPNRFRRRPSASNRTAWMRDLDIRFDPSGCRLFRTHKTSSNLGHNFRSLPRVDCCAPWLLCCSKSNDDIGGMPSDQRLVAKVIVCGQNKFIIHKDQLFAHTNQSVTSQGNIVDNWKCVHRRCCIRIWTWDQKFKPETENHLHSSTAAAILNGQDYSVSQELYSVKSNPMETPPNTPPMTSSTTPAPSRGNVLKQLLLAGKILALFTLHVKPLAGNTQKIISSFVQARKSKNVHSVRLIPADLQRPLCRNLPGPSSSTRHQLGPL